MIVPYCVLHNEKLGRDLYVNNLDYLLLQAHVRINIFVNFIYLSILGLHHILRQVINIQNGYKLLKEPTVMQK